MRERERERESTQLRREGATSFLFLKEFIRASAKSCSRINNDVMYNSGRCDLTYSGGKYLRIDGTGVSAARRIDALENDAMQKKRENWL